VLGFPGNSQSAVDDRRRLEAVRFGDGFLQPFDKRRQLLLGQGDDVVDERRGLLHELGL